MAEHKSETKVETKTEKTTVKDPVVPKSAVTFSGSLPVPIVLDLRKKKKRRYSSGTKTFQQAGFGVLKSSYRVSNGVAEGVKRFYKGSRKSSRKRKDGLLVDLLDNSARGFRDGTRELAKAPYDFAKRINTKPLARFLRNSFGL